MTAPEPVEVEAEELAAAERLRYLVESGRSPTLPLSEARALLAEFDRLRAELTRTVADCGICRLGARTVHVDDDCPRHGEGL